jgi:hypothetical protein
VDPEVLERDEQTLVDRLPQAQLGGEAAVQTTR